MWRGGRGRLRATECRDNWTRRTEDTTFVSTRGLVRFKVMPFGMVNSGSTYSRMIRKLLNGTENLKSYVNDILGHSKEWDFHLKILRNFFNRVRNANLV